MRGKKGARVGVFAIYPYGGHAYATARMSVVAYPDWEPLNAPEAMDAWWQHKPVAQCTVRSNLRRRLAVSGGHAQKLEQAITERWHSNVLLLPVDWEQSGQMAQVLRELLSSLKNSPTWALHQRWLQPVVTGLGSGDLVNASGKNSGGNSGGRHVMSGKYAVPGVHVVVPVARQHRHMRSTYLDKEMPWAMIQRWLSTVLPIPGLRTWYGREEYLQRRLLRIERGVERIERGGGVK